MSTKTGIVLFVLFLIVFIGVGLALFGDDLFGSDSTGGLAHQEANTFTPITFTGSSEQTTDLFTVTTDTWEVEWSYTIAGDWTSLIFYVYPEGNSDDYYVLSVFALDPSKTSGSIYCSAGAGQYYIKVKCANISSWTITIKPY